jgi:hypothetical protein
MPLISCPLTSSVQQRELSWTRYVLLIGLLVLLGLGSRLLSAQDASFEGERVQPALVSDYKHGGQLYRNYFTSFLDRNSLLSNPDLLAHPPGYSLLWALIFKLRGGDRAMQFVQILCDAASVLVVFLITGELLPRVVAFFAAQFAALAPQFTWNSVVLLPDTIAVLPILLAVYCLIVAAKRRRIAAALACGVLIGVSCWLRPNALLLAPFCCLIAPLLFVQKERLQYAGAIVCGAVLIIAPLMIRNAIVFRYFVPLSLGAGQTMLEGISDYDQTQRFGIPNTDIEIMREEAQQFGRPAYAETLFGPDGVARERMRVQRAFSVIQTHPVWFAGVMAHRAASMLRLERAPVVAATPSVSHSLSALESREPLETIAPQRFIVNSPDRKLEFLTGGQSVKLTGENSKNGILLSSPSVALRENTDYVFTIPIRMRQGRFIVEVMSVNEQRVYVRSFVDAALGLSAEEQRATTLQLPFVAGANEDVRISFSNGGSNLSYPVGEIGKLALFELGPASQAWTRVPRVILRMLQRLFITAVALPLMLLGAVVLIHNRCWPTLAILLLVPAYYLCFQSAIHTEYRYVLALHYFLFILVATGVWYLGTRASSVIVHMRREH